MNTCAHSGIYELFCKAWELGTHFLVRTCVDRLIEDSKQTVADRMEIAKMEGIRSIEFYDAEGNKLPADLEIKTSVSNCYPLLANRKSTLLSNLQ